MTFNAIEIAILQTLHGPTLLEVRCNVPEKRSNVL